MKFPASGEEVLGR